jgi:SAM-dependent methyltransferase
VGRVAREVTPRFVQRAFARWRGGRGATVDAWDALGGAEATADWYDERFDEEPEWREHYTRSPYYHFWTVIADRLLHMPSPSVLEIGCGAGQFAALLRDRHVSAYVGFDFAPKRLAFAALLVPEFRFLVADALTTDVYDSVPYDSVVCTEFLEHVERDLDVVARVRPGARFLGTVPNFGGGSHVRHFDDAAAVRARYRPVIDGLRIDEFPNRRGDVHFLLDGTVRNPG